MVSRILGSDLARSSYAPGVAPASYNGDQYDPPKLFGMQGDVSAWPWLQHERTDAAGLFLASGSYIQSMTEPDPQCD